MRSFRRDEKGYVLTLTLLVLPIYIGFAFIIIDIGRGNNAHADLQAAADAVALAGARELDGGADAITRAHAAMARVSNNVSMLARSGSDMQIDLPYVTGSTTDAFQVAFLRTIPASDDDPLDFSLSNQTTDPFEAEYVFVRAQSIDLDTAFFNPAVAVSRNVPIAAEAVAQGFSAACKIPPLYICNPFEYDDSGNYDGDNLQERFSDGDLHGRMIRLHPKGNSTHGPGNFGFLSVNGSSSADAIRDIFAGNANPTCYSSSNVTTKPGAATSISQGINTRFDVYEGSFSNWNNTAPNSFVIGPAENVRKGYKPGTKVQGANLTIYDCVKPGGGTNAGVKSDDHVWDPSTGTFNANGVDDHAYGLPDNLTMAAPNTAPSGSATPGAYLGTGDWPIADYFMENYGIAVPSELGSSGSANSFANNSSTFGSSHASRYDVYRWEIDQGASVLTDRAAGDPSVLVQGSTVDNGEMAAPMCGPNKPGNNQILPITSEDRRIMVAAIIDCGSNPDANGVTDFPVNSYASFFMTRPMQKVSPSVDSTIDVEIVDITGYGGNGTLETFIRAEAVLVR